jgi:hypothetical protein
VPRSFTLGEDFSSVFCHYGAHNKETEARALDPGHNAARHAVEPFEDSFQLRRGNTNTAILDSHRYLLIIQCGDLKRDLHVLNGILDGIVKQV